MKSKKRTVDTVSERQLAEFAKHCRIKAGISKAEAARQFRVNRATMQQAEEYPKISLTKLRVKMIKKYSAFTVVGPVFLLIRK